MRNPLFLALVATIVIGLGACKEKGIKTEHGFTFINHTNKGTTKPQPGENVIVTVSTYVGDSLMGSSQGPRQITLYTPDKMPQRVPPIFDAVLLMGEGDSATVYQDIDSLIRNNIPPALKKEQQVRYEVTLVDVISKEETDKKKQEADAMLQTVTTNAATTLADFKANKLNDKITTTPSGLKVLLLEKGSGDAIKAGSQVTTDYYGYMMSDGKMFDNSYSRGEAMTFTVGQMIPGFDEGMQMLNMHGGKAYFFIPYKLGYGEQGGGPIPPKADLVFYVETK